MYEMFTCHYHNLFTCFCIEWQQRKTSLYEILKYPAYNYEVPGRTNSYKFPHYLILLPQMEVWL